MSLRQNGNGGSSQGPAVDSTGTPVIDPTKNVSEQLNAAIKRIDDLSAVTLRFVDAKLETLDRVISLQVGLAELRAQHNAETARLHSEHNREMGQERADGQEKLAVAEAKRIDAIRAVDVAAVATASERAAQQATVLANQLITSTEALRVSASAQATTIASQLQSTINPLVEKIGTLERTQYENKGKSGVSDPALADAMREMTISIGRLQTVQATSGGKTEGLSTATAIGLGIVTFISALLGIGGVLFAIFKATNGG